MFQPGGFIRAPQLVSEKQWQRNLIHLQPSAYRATIDPGVLRKTAIRSLLHLE
jgi:hypothetical protein